MGLPIAEYNSFESIFDTKNLEDKLNHTHLRDLVGGGANEQSVMKREENEEGESRMEMRTEEDNAKGG